MNITSNWFTTVCQYMQGYMIYMWNTPELNVSKEDMELLFGNIDAIYNFNQ